MSHTHDRPRRQAGRFSEIMALVIAVVAILLFVAWQVTSRAVPPETDRMKQETEFLGMELATVSERLQQARARQKVLEREADVLRRANRLLREQESERQGELNRLQSELDFFRRLAGTGGSLEGLDIYHAEITPTTSERVFRFELTLTQNIRRAGIVSGRVRVDVEGTLDDRPVTLHWADISDGDSPEPAFRFKYFEQLDGYISLPPGFSPTQLLLTLEPGQGQQAVQRRFDWPQWTDEALPQGPGSS